MSIPLPTNIIPYWFFPWNTDSWSGFTPFIYHKEIFVIDSVRQIFVWHDFGFSFLKQGIIPLWNPYNFAGQPFVANFQSSVFYPLNWFHFVLPSIVAWSIYILVQPIILALASYLFFNYLFRNKIASLLCSIGLSFSSFFSIHYFWGVSTQPLIWFPLSLYLTELFKDKKINSAKFIFFQTIVISLVFLGGYPQSSVFSLGLTAAYFLFRVGKGGILKYILAGVLAVGICSVQIIPTLELYKLSPREGVISNEIVENSFISAKHLVMAISPDYFGSPATNNYFGGSDYSGVNSYFGIVLLPLSLFALKNFRKDKNVLFWSCVAVFGLLMSLANPISHLPSILKIPILSSGAPWYYILFFQIGMIVLSGFGLIDLMKSPTKNAWFTAVLLIVSGLIISLLITGRHSSISENNTLKVAAVFFVFAVGYFFSAKRIGFLAVLLTLISGFYFCQRVMPFGEVRYMYPDHPLVSFLQKNAQIDRFWGPEDAHIPSNLGTYFRIQQLEGYDSLWPKRYGELIAGAANGQFSNSINRAEVIMTQDDNLSRRRLLNLMGVKYFLDKSNSPGGDTGPNILKFPPEQFKLAGRWKVASVYENTDSYPRAFMASHYIVATKQSALTKVYDQSINLRDTLILEKDPKIKNLSTGAAKINSYNLNTVKIKTSSIGTSLLLLSDNYFPGWEAYVNGNKTEILRADYSLRAVIVPPGNNNVLFVYNPRSFEVGKAVSLVSLLILCAFFPLLLKRNGSH